MEIEFKPSALKDLRSINNKNAIKILIKIENMKDGLKGDVKRLTNFTPEYRLRVGNYRVLFEIEDNIITIYAVKHRREAY
jgi:mRNA interferase RelE/StbE